MSLLFRFIICFLFVVIFPLLGVVLLVLFWPSWFLIPLIIMFFVFLKIRRQRMVQALIQTALESETPIHEVLYSYASMCWGPWYRAKLIRFADKLQAGYSIVDTASIVKGVIGYNIIGLIKLGGTKLPDKLFTQTAGDVYPNGRIQEQSLFRFIWYYWYLPFLLFPTLLYTFVDLPRMKYIFRDFGLTLPSITLFVINFVHDFVKYWYLSLPLLFILILIPIFYFNFRSGIIPWRPFGVRRILRQRDSAQFLRLFAAGLELKRPIEEIVNVYSQVVPSRYLCRLGQYFNTQIAQGADWIESLQKIHWLSRSEAALLESAVRTDHVEAMLLEVAGGKEQQQHTSDIVQIQLFSILFVILLGIYIAILALSLFMPFITLITVLAN